MDPLKNSRGSTSVLIIVMMIALIAFGMAALTTAAAGLKLSRNSADFHKDFYALEGEAHAMAFDLLAMAHETAEAGGPFGSGMAARLAGSGKEGSAFNLLEIREDAVLVGWQVSELSNRPKVLHAKVLVQQPRPGATLRDILHVVDWYETQEGIGEIRDTIEFEDPF